MPVFRLVLSSALLINLICWHPAQSQAACGDGTLQTSDLLYGADGAGGDPSNLYILDPSSGSVVKIVGPIGSSVTGLAVNPRTGELFGITNNDPTRGFLLLIDETTGAGTEIGDIEPANNSTTAGDITFTPDGTLFGWLTVINDLATIDLISGLATVVGDSTLNTPLGRALAAESGDTLLLAGNGSDGDLTFINPDTGLKTSSVVLNGYSGTGDSISAMDFNATGVLYGVAIDNEQNSGTFDTDLITIDTASGLITTVGPSAHHLDAIAFAEPEACDDGNTVAGDGCSADCKSIEAGFDCTQPGQPCQGCGNGNVEGTEICDDGNTVAGDGCSTDCLGIEPGFACPSAGGPCTAIQTGELSGSGCSLNSPRGSSPSAWLYLAGFLKSL